MQECRNANIENTFENSYKLDVFVQKVKELEKIRKKSELYNAIIDESLEKFLIECRKLKVRKTNQMNNYNYLKIRF